MRPLLTVALLLVAAATVAANDDLTVLKADGDNPAPRTLRAHLLAEAQKLFDARRATVATLKTPNDVQKRQKELRAKFIAALGGFPEKAPLNARVVGTNQRDGYRLERVVYESRPDHHVTANLYLPDGKGPFPAVLMPIGHSAEGKADGSVQRGAILLARNGLAALAYDPIGQGERRQLLDDQGRPAIPSSTSEHTMAGVGALLVGRNTASYRIWDGIRSLDYLASRPDIDAHRLGCTGCSGGGTLTSYLMALDDRVAVAAPSCYVTSLGAAVRYHRSAGCRAEHHRTGRLRHGARRLPDPARCEANTHLRCHARLLRHPGDVDEFPRGQAHVRAAGPPRARGPGRVRQRARFPQAAARGDGALDAPLAAEGR
jgi:cephalosporin-C deacetylase-like acetyl esterase